MEVKDRILASDNTLTIGQMDGSGGVKNLTSLDIYSDATKFHGDVEADGDLIGERLILTQNTKTYFRGGSDGIPEYSRNGSTYYDFITTENHKQDVDNVNLVVSGGASGTATHTIVPNSSYTINISGLNASYLNSGTIPGARMSSNGSMYSHVTVGKAGYATQAQKANIASQLNGLSSTSGTLATQAYVKSAVQSATIPTTVNRTLVSGRNFTYNFNLNTIKGIYGNSVSMADVILDSNSYDNCYDVGGGPAYITENGVVVAKQWNWGEMNSICDNQLVRIYAGKSYVAHSQLSSRGNSTSVRLVHVWY